jgi:hypothetical protein
MIPAPIMAAWAVLRGSWAAQAVAAVLGALVLLKAAGWRGERRGRAAQRADGEAQSRRNVDAMHDRVDEAWDLAADDGRDVDERLRDLDALRPGD